MTRRVSPRWTKSLGDLLIFVGMCSLVGAALPLTMMIVLAISGDLPSGPTAGGLPVSYLLWFYIPLIGGLSCIGAPLFLLLISDPDD